MVTAPTWYACKHAVDHSKHAEAKLQLVDKSRARLTKYMSRRVRGKGLLPGAPGLPYEEPAQAHCIVRSLAYLSTWLPQQPCCSWLWAFSIAHWSSPCMFRWWLCQPWGGWYGRALTWRTCNKANSNVQMGACCCKAGGLHCRERLMHSQNRMAPQRAHKSKKGSVACTTGPTWTA